MITVGMVPNTWHPTQDQNKTILALKALLICVFAEHAVKKLSWWEIHCLSMYLTVIENNHMHGMLETGFVCYKISRGPGGGQSAGDCLCVTKLNKRELVQQRDTQEERKKQHLHVVVHSPILLSRLQYDLRNACQVLA